MTTVIDMVTDYLKSNGFDGLHNDDECGCKVGDLAPCNSDFSRCKPGYEVTLKYFDGEETWGIGPEKCYDN